MVYVCPMEAAARPGSLEGLSEFLVDHHTCGGGFDVSHPGGVGNGRIRMTCSGCGRSFEYVPGLVEVEREVEIVPTSGSATVIPLDPTPPPPAPAVEPAPEPEPSSEPAARPGPPPPANADAAPIPSRIGATGTKERRSRRSRIVVIALLLFAVAALAFAAIRVADDRNATTSSSPSPAAAPAAPAERTVTTPRYSVAVPQAWKQSDDDGNLLFSGPGSAATVEVFDSKNPGMSLLGMTNSTSDFLASRTPGGKVSAPKDGKLDGRTAFQVVDRGPDGVETALGVLDGPFRYIVVGSALSSATEAEREAVSRALSGFSLR
jgi:hypothetical protein